MSSNAESQQSQAIRELVEDLLASMTLAEKIGQLAQVNIGDGHDGNEYHDALRAGGIGSLINIVDVDTVNALQRIAVEESRLGIPLIIGRDVIHGFHTVMPIPLGQAASFDPEVARAGAEVAAREAATAGVNWTFAPMIDVSRDPRWGRIAESLGEDPTLACAMGAAMVRGFQGDDLAAPGSIAACGKHFAGYGAVESGRDYATTNLPENELRNVYLPPFKAAVDAGVVSLMTSFSDIDGVPATANDFLLRTVLRDEWAFDGFVVSDWDSIRQLAIHGLTASDRESAVEAIRAGVDMEMHGDAYSGNLEALVEDGHVDVALVDSAVRNILRAKFHLGLFEQPYAEPERLPRTGDEAALDVAHRAARESIVMLKNDGPVLPLSPGALKSLAVIGPLADAPTEQLGTWIFDGDPHLSVTPLEALRKALRSGVKLDYIEALPHTRSHDHSAFERAADLASASDAVLLFLGEEAILSGEAHSRADITLPGAQAELVRRVRETGKPVVAVIQAGRPLVLTNIVDHVDAILYAWHGGTMAGPAIVDILLGVASPSGKLPASFPRMVGQIPIYHSQKNTGKPPTDETVVLIDDIDPNATQLSTGMTAYHLDAGFRPLYPFGFGLSYATFRYSKLRLSADELPVGETLTVTASVTNESAVAASEVVQLYVRDLVGSVTRPVKELKGFQKIRIEPGETIDVTFNLSPDDLAFYGRRMQRVVEPGEFHIWVGGSSEAELMASFRLTGDPM